MRAAAGAQAPPEGGSKSVQTYSPRSAYAGLRIFLRVRGGGVSACPLARAKRTSNGAAKGVR